MKYKKFIIQNYRAISNCIEIDIDSKKLIPIIGINECGKTTILQAIFSFDYHKDRLNSAGRHLKDLQNLYSTESLIPTISAEIEISKDEIYAIIDQLRSYRTGDDARLAGRYLDLLENFSGKIIITRDLSEKKYNIDYHNFKNKKINNLLSKEIVKNLPYILYFDDFRDSIDAKLEINDDESSGWLPIIERLFKKTNSNYSVCDLDKKEERQRKSILSQVNKKLNETLTKEWQNFNLDDSNALKISLGYKEESSVRKFITLDIIEKDRDDLEHFFYIRDRSKGFYWFFNFVMKLQFNPKINQEPVIEINDGSIFLLDEPGSYLHSSAQNKLCKKLQELSRDNNVVYCTHSHYLLNPEVIPINNIKIADKSHNGNIELSSIHEYNSTKRDKKYAFQPIIDALQVKPFLLDINCKNILIVEVIYDYYSFEIFKPKEDIYILPSTTAKSIKFFISIMIAWGLNYKALWDNDIDGKKAKKEAEIFFGKEEAKRFYLLPLKSNRSKKCILQNLFHGDDIKLIKQKLTLPKNTSFEKVILNLFYSDCKKEVVENISIHTQQNFKEVFEILNF